VVDSDDVNVGADKSCTENITACSIIISLLAQFDTSFWTSEVIALTDTTEAIDTDLASRWKDCRASGNVVD
jgi:hypothetical protein